MRASSRRIALAAMGTVLLAYVVMHSPLRDSIGELIGFERRTCYFCLPDPTGFDFPDWLAAAALLAVAGLAAWALGHRFPGPAYERLLVAGLASVALVTVPAAALGGLSSLLGVALLRPPAGPLLALIPSALVLGLALRSGWRPRLPGRRFALDTPLLKATVVGAGALLAAEVAVSLLHPPSQGDALTYHAPLGVLFWTDGDLTSMLDRSPETWGLTHPGTAELWFGALRLLGGERLANLGQLPFALIGAVAVYAFTRRTGLRRGAGTLAAAAFLLTPMAVLQVGTQGNDLAGAALVMAAVAVACAPVREWGPARAAVLGLALGLAAATKLAVIPGVAGVLLAVGMIALTRGRRHLRAGPKAAVALSLAFLAVVLPWWLRNAVREGNPIFPQEIPGYGHGVELGGGIDLDFDFVERKVAWPVYPLIEPVDERSGFGAVLAVAIVPGLLAWRQRARRLPLAVFASALGVTLVFWWVFSHHEPRFLLAYAGLACALVPWALFALSHRRRALGAGLLAVAAAFSFAVTADQQVLPLGRQPVEREAFYDRVYGVDPAVDGVPEGQGVLLFTGLGLGTIDYTAYYPLLGRSQDRSVAQLDADLVRGDRQVVIGRMRRLGLRYVYLQAAPRFAERVDRLFSPPEFERVSTSAIVRGERLGVRRTAYGPASPGQPPLVRRYLFRLASP